MHAEHSPQIICLADERRKRKAKPRHVILDREASSPFLPISPAAAWVFGVATGFAVASAMVAMFWSYQR